MIRIHSSPFVCTFFGSLWLLIGSACRTPPPSLPVDGSMPLTPVLQSEKAESASAEALAWFGIAMHREIQGDASGAMDAYIEAMERDPENEAITLYAIQRLIRANRTEDAFAMLDTLLERTPNHLQALRWKARLHQQEKNPEAALELYRQALLLAPEDEILYLEVLQAAIQSGDTEMALDVGRAGIRHVADAARLTEITLRMLDAAAENATDLVTLDELREEFTRTLDQALTRYPDQAVFLYLSAEKALARQQAGEAFAAYLQIDELAEDRDDERARMLVHAIQHLGGGRRGARAFREAAEQQSGQALVLYLQGLLWELQGSENNAAEAYQKAVELAPEDLPALRKLAVLAFQQQKPAQSLRLLEKAFSHHPEDPELLLLTGQIALASGQYSKAVRFLNRRMDQVRQGIELDNPPLVNAQLAMALWETQGDPAKIEHLLEQAAEVPGHLELAWQHRIRSIFQLRETDPERATTLETDLLQTLEDLCDRLPRNPEPAWLTATTYSFRKEFSQTLEFLREVEFRANFSQDPEQWLGDKYWFDVAAALERTGQPDQAEKIFLSIIERNPGHHSSLNYVAYMWAEQGKHLDRALEFIQKALRLDPENGSYIDTLGWIYYQQGHFEDAYQELVRSSELVPDEPVVLEHLGDVLMKLNRPVEARGYYRIALMLDPAERREIVLESLEAAENASAEH